MVHISFNEFCWISCTFLKAISESSISTLGKVCIPKSVSACCPPVSTYTTPGLFWGIVKHLNNLSILTKKSQEESPDPGLHIFVALNLYLVFINSILFFYCDCVLYDLAPKLRVETCFVNSSQSLPLSLARFLKIHLD
jgi:hypothetical protein